MNAYIAGQIVQANGSFTNLSGTAIDPSEVVFAVMKPGAAWVEYKYPAISTIISRVGTGLYQVFLDTTGLPGVWTYQWAGNGACQVTGKSVTFNVSEPAYTPSF